MEIDTSIAERILKPWYISLRDPARAQRKVLEDLIPQYMTTRYGERLAPEDIKCFQDYRKSFHILDYNRLDQLIEEVRRGEYKALLSEPPEYWVMTRGSTGKPKVLPATKKHLEQIFMCGARALLNHINRTGDLELVKGKILNLSFPSRTTTFKPGERDQNYGYSSGTYSRLFSSLGGVSLVPQQEKIDSLGPGIAKSDWERRFQLVYEEALDENVTAVMGVAPVILSFARFVKKEYGRFPKDIWRLRAIFPTSVRKIHYRYEPKFKKYFGEIQVVEIYSATEGVFAQQKDHLPYVTPNYDSYLFEVETKDGTKMLHELERGEWGRLIVSTCMFPRYDIGDMIESMGKQYYRVFGRAKFLHTLEHRLYRLFFGWLL